MVTRWMRSQHRLANERGIALAVVLLMLVVILLLGSTLVGLSMTENQAGSTVADVKKAFSAAETGIQEAMYRMRLDPTTLSDEGDTPYSATADPVVIGFVQGGVLTVSSPDPTNVNFWHYNPSWSYAAGGGGASYGNFLGGNAANLDSAGRTFTSSGSSHATGGALGNSNLANGASYTVTVAPVVGFVGGCWQYVDQAGAPLGSCASVATNPMFKVTATGTAGSARKTLSTIIRRFNVSPKPEAALTANSDTNLSNVQSAAAVIDGHNFDCNGNHPSNTDSVKAVTVPSGASVSINKPQNLECTAGTGVTNCVGNFSTFPDTLGALLLGWGANTKEIDTLNAYLESIKITPANAPTSAFHGILYVNGNYTKPPDGSTGVLIVHNASNSANLGNFNTGTFKGLIIADGIDKVNGNAQIIGSIFAFGSAGTVRADDVTGTPDIKYSKCVIAGLPKYFPFRNVPGTWHEQ